MANDTWCTSTAALLVGGVCLIHSSAPLAETRSAEEAYQLAQRYEHGEGLPRDHELAFQHYCQAAQGGHAAARHGIAWMYLNGRGTGINEALAGYWLRLAADAGDSHSEKLLKRLAFSSDQTDQRCVLAEPEAAETELVQADAKPETAIEPAPRTAALPVSAPACYQIGPVDRRGKRKAVGRWLLSNAIEHQTVTRSVSYGLVFQVYSKPLSNRASAYRAADRYRGRGVKDLQVISTGVLTNGISLGAYRYESQAAARVEQLQAKGIKAAYRTQNPMHHQQWMRFSASSESAAALGDAFPSLEVEDAQCPDQETVITAALIQRS